MKIARTLTKAGGGIFIPDFVSVIRLGLGWLSYPETFNGKAVLLFVTPLRVKSLAI